MNRTTQEAQKHQAVVKAAIKDVKKLNEKLKNTLHGATVSRCEH